jgi:hypothetical protein
MLVPDSEGFYQCAECDFETEDIFALFNHCKLDFSFNLRLTRNHILDLFALMRGINDELLESNVYEARELVQMATLTLVNAGEGKNEFNKFIGEAFVKEDAELLIKELEDMLKKEKDNG